MLCTEDSDKLEVGDKQWESENQISNSLIFWLEE